MAPNVVLVTGSVEMLTASQRRVIYVQKNITAELVRIDSTTSLDLVLTLCITGLVGQGIRYVIENEPIGSKFGKQSKDEQWIFLSSKDGDLK